MDTKKTIGAVIGVIAFVALIAGATFAWFTASATVTNATYNGTACSYALTVTGGNINTSLPLASSTASSDYHYSKTHATIGAQGVMSTVTAKLASACSASLAGTAKIEAKITSGASPTCPLSYAVFSGSTTTYTGTPLATGTITGTSPVTLTTTNTLTTTAQTYKIWLYLDGDKISDSTCMNLAYTGNITVTSTSK